MITSHARCSTFLLLSSALLVSQVHAWSVGAPSLALRDATRNRCSKGVVGLRAEGSHAPDVSLCDSRHNRRHLLGLFAGFVATPAFAAIPSMEEYNVGTGSVVKSDKAIEKNEFSPPTDKANALAAVKVALAQLDSFKGLIEKQVAASCALALLLPVARS